MEKKKSLHGTIVLTILYGNSPSGETQIRGILISNTTGVPLSSYL